MMLATLLLSLLAQFGIGEAALWVVRVIAAVGGAFVGWFVTDPIARIAYRLAAHKPIPGWTLPWLKAGGATLLALLIYFFIPLGGGPGGWGHGPGLGGGPGKGPGEGGTGKDTAAVKDGGKKADDTKASTEKDKTKLPGKTPETTVRKPVEIEVLGGERVSADERYYLLRPTGKAMSLKEVEAYFKENGAKLELHIVLTEDSPDEGLGIIEDLTRLADRYQIPSLIVRPKKK
jgi:hypothetical protein